MTGQEMKDEVKRQLRNNSLETEADIWIYDSILALATRYVFRLLISRNTATTVSNTPDIELDTNFHNPLVFFIPSENRKLEPVDEIELATCYPKYRSTQGTIQGYYLSGRTLSLWQVPASVLDIGYTYIRRPSKLAFHLSGEYPDLPTEWHQVACLRAIIKGAKYMGDTDVLQMAKVEERELVSELKPTIYQRPDVHHILRSHNPRMAGYNSRLGDAKGWKLVNGQWVQ